MPSGVYDFAHNEAWVSGGITPDTAAFAVASIAQGWRPPGRQRYSSPSRLLITADSGGSNKSQSTREAGTATPS